MSSNSFRPTRLLVSGVVLVASILLVTSASAAVTLLSEYTFEDLSTANVATDSISANNGGPFGNPAPVSSTDVPYVSKDNLASAAFDGQNYFQISNSLGSSFSICAWIKTASVGGVPHWESAPITDAESGGWALDFGFGLNSQGKLIYGNGGFDPSNNPYDGWVDGNTAVNDSNWHNVCVTRDNTNGAVKLYVDGVIDADGQTGTGVLTSNPNIKIGNGSDGNRPFVGNIDNLQLYTTVLTSEDVYAQAHPAIVTDEPTVDPTPRVLADTGKSDSLPLIAIALGFIGLGSGVSAFAYRRKQRS